MADEVRSFKISDDCILVFKTGKGTSKTSNNEFFTVSALIPGQFGIEAFTFFVEPDVFYSVKETGYYIPKWGPKGKALGFELLKPVVL